MLDELTSKVFPQHLEMYPFTLIRDKRIVIVRIKEDDTKKNKSYLRNLFILVGNEFVTTNYSDTMQLLSEIKLFNRGNKQNKYTNLVDFQGDVNLKLKLTNDHIHISRAEAMSITDIMKDAKSGLTMTRVFDNEYPFSAELITTHLIKSGLLNWFDE